MGPYIYVWKRAGGVTEEWHPEAGLVVVALSLEAAREALKASPGVKAGCEAFQNEPDYVWTLADGLGKVLIFPNTGCC